MVEAGRKMTEDSRELNSHPTPRPLFLLPQDGGTPAYMAAANGHVEALKALAAAGADMDKADDVSASGRDEER